MTFEHGCASGDPLSDRVCLWTRVTAADPSVPVEWCVARDRGLTDVVVSGEARARAVRDHCVCVDVDGLEPDTVYHYAFVAHGDRSPVARTKTLPGPDAERVRFATCSCAKYNAGFFNAYARIAERDDLDFLLHLGDYIYEAANRPPPRQTPGADIGRPFDPPDECRTLEDYRRRYSQYRRDPDVQALHHALPIVPTIDDHELADGAWAGGASEHRPDEHGPWERRRDAALRARWEWMPLRQPDSSDPTRVYRSIRVGDLAEVFLLDIRSRRDEPALDPRMSEPDRSMLGTAQRGWLLAGLDASDAAWRIVATPSLMTRTWIEGADEPLHDALLKLKLIDEDGTGPDEDQWDGYPAERAALLERFRRLGDVVVLSADVHVSIAAELHAKAGGAVAPEFVAPSLTAQNLDEKLGVERRAPEVLAAEEAFVAAHGHVHWCEMASHGYVVVDVDRERVRGEWWHLDGVLERTPGESRAAAYRVERGSPALVPDAQ